MGKDKIGWGMTGCGALTAMVFFMSVLFWGFNVFIEPGGAISADEAMPGMLGSCCCVLISLGLAAAGLFLAMKAKKDAAAAG